MNHVREHIRGNVVGYVALFFALSGGVAFATHPGGADTISTGDIINNEVRAADIGPSQVNASDIADGAVHTEEILDSEVKSADIRNSEVRSADVLDNSLGGADVDEGTLGIVPNADQLDGQDSTDFLPSSSILTTVLSDGEQGWNPDGANFNFPITDESFDVAKDLIVVNLDGDSTAPIATCAVSNLAFEAFTVTCTSAPPDGAELRYATITL